MAHADIIIDKDPCFEINTATRQITNMTADKTSLIQYDHNSERFGFTMPRFVEGHDMSICDRIEVHYINSDGMTQEQIEGVYEVTDVAISDEDEEKIVFSWIISQNATGYVGALVFLIRFVCVEEDATVSYAWNTAIFTGVKIEKGMYNSDEIVAEYADVLEQWRIELFENSVYAKKDEAISLWQPNTEYKAGRYVIVENVLNETSGSAGLALCRCVDDHTSDDEFDAYYWFIKYLDQADIAFSDIFGNPIHATYATKEELENSGGGGTTTKEWQLVEDITLTEAVAQIDIAKEKLQFKEVHIEGLIIPTDTTTTTQTVQLSTGGHTFWQGKGNPKATGKFYLLSDLFISPDKKVLCNGTISAYHYAQGESFTATGYFFLQDITHEYISALFQTALFIRTNTENGFGVGTKIKVWGR